MNENPYHDIAATSIYPKLARATLYKLHSNLLEMLGKALDRSKQNNLLVVGPGAEVLPFSEELSWVYENLNGGNLILLDYNKEIIKKAQDYLYGKEFHSPLFKYVRQDGRVIDPRQAKRTIFFEARDVRERLPYKDGSLSAVDMTLSIHHATTYRQDIKKIFDDVHRVLSTGGVLHLGEGNVDMKHSEVKIRKLCRYLMAGGEDAVHITDRRAAVNGYLREFQLNKVFLEKEWNVSCKDPLPESDQRYGCMLAVDDKGMVEITGLKNPTKSAELLQLNGYKQMFATGNGIILPLIDCSIQYDFEGMIKPVLEYYDSIQKVGLSNLEPDDIVRAEFLKKLEKERSDALRGIVEYYSPPSMVKECLKESNFEIEETRCTAPHGPFVNILARKTA